MSLPLPLSSISSPRMSPSERARSGNRLARELSGLLTSDPHDGRSIHYAAGGVIRCSCPSHSRSGTVQCTQCDTYQHLACYYPATQPLSLPERQRHLCRPCRARLADHPADPAIAKRKADEDLGSTSPKRIKQSNSPQPELPADPKDPRPAGKPVPFPEKVATVHPHFCCMVC